MDGISSTPIENSVQFLRLRDKYKSDILEDSRLTKAAGLAAQQELLLKSTAPDTWKEPRLKSVNRQLRVWTKKIRQPGGTRAIGDDIGSDEEDERNLAIGPMQQFMGNIAKIRRGIKRPATTPQVKQSPVTPTIKTPPQSTSKKPKYSLKTGSTAKRLLPKTPLKKSSIAKALHYSKKKIPVSPSSYDTAEEFEGAQGESPLLKEKSIKKKSTPSPVESFISKATEKALKKLAPAPGWKPFGTPKKRKLDGKDY